MKKSTLQLISSLIAIVLVAAMVVFLLDQPETLEWFQVIDINVSPLVIPFVIFGVLLVGGAITYYEYHGIGCQDGITRRGPDENVVAITFDDGPNPNYTPQLLDILKEKGVKATFFVVGLHVKKYPDIAKRIVDEGHDIGNHTYTHKDMVPSTRRMVLAQVNKTDHVITKITGVKTSLFRPPRGIYGSAVRRLLVDEKKYRMILWSVSSVDWRGISATAIHKRIMRYVRPGSILLFHDSGALVRREGASRENTVEALPTVIDSLIAKGYRIVTITEMLERIEAEEIKEGVLSQA
ncbi:MAG: polysaccharide deacetylase family protein [Rubrobacteridae bacterium]|nr:polysaccharide deacetylase family protein [Rubrobacteridae bacterium]